LVPLIALLSVAGCGGDESSPQLVDGSQAAELPAALEELGDGVLTRTSVLPPGQIDKGRFTACGHPPIPGDTVIVERTGVQGASWTFATGSSLYGCDQIANPAEDPDDDPYGGRWCASPSGRLEGSTLNDPRLNLCTNTVGELTAFVWIEPQLETKWVVVSDAGKREVYQVAESLPVRVTTTENINPEGSASFDVEEYTADGSTRLREYTLDAQVAG
jgi:hypothetical protein